MSQDIITDSLGYDVGNHQIPHGMWKWLTLWCCVWALIVFGITSWPVTLLEDDSKTGSDCYLESIPLLIPWQRSGGGRGEGGLKELVQTYAMCLLYQDPVTLNCSLLPAFHSGEARAGLSICSASNFAPLYSFFHRCRSDVSACLDWSFQWPSIAFRIPSLVRPSASFLIIPCLIPHSLNCPGFPQSTSLQNSLLSDVHPVKSYPFPGSQARWRHLFRDACPGHEVPLSLVPYHSVLTPLLSPAFVICPSPRQGRTASFSPAPSRVSDLC